MRLKDKKIENFQKIYHKTIIYLLTKTLFKIRICQKRIFATMVKEKHSLDNLAKRENKCDICEETFASEANLTRHVRSIHEGKKAYKCDICSTGFAAKQNWNRHMKSSVHEEKKPNECEICEKRFLTKRYLTKHIVLVHKNIKLQHCINAIFVMQLSLQKTY